MNHYSGCFYIPQDLQENNTLQGYYAEGISKRAVHHLSEFFHSIINAEKRSHSGSGKRGGICLLPEFTIR